MNKKELYRKLVEEITIIDINRFNYSDSFRAGEAAGKIKGLESAKKLLNQLEEPELPVIPLYRVLMPNRTYLVQSDIENYEHWFNERVEMYNNVTYEFTEQEIKAIDERYWIFREEVEV